MTKLKKASKRTIALFAAALILFGSSGAMGSRAALTATSDPYDATMALNELSVELTENGSKPEGDLLTSLADKTISPGREYDETIQAKNTSSKADEYIRIVVRKYWTNEDGSKDCELTPDLIKLSYDGKDYNDSAWQIGDNSTDEMSIYYCKSKVGAGGSTAPLFDTFSIDAVVASDEYCTETVTSEGGKTIYTYTYEYDGCIFNVEAEAQAVQTHNAKDAITSIWGVDPSSVGISVQ